MAAARPIVTMPPTKPSDAVTIGVMPASVKSAQRVECAITVMIAKVDRRDPLALAVAAAPVGRRQLERDFHSLGTSMAAELRRIRVELAAGELAHRRAASRQIRGVAMRLGYADERRLREATAAAFSLTPGEIRRGARIQRQRAQAEAARRQGQKRPARGIWASDRRPRRDREALDDLLRKANSAGSALLTSEEKRPRAAEARERAAALARNRVEELFASVRRPLRSVA